MGVRPFKAAGKGHGTARPGRSGHWPNRQGGTFWWCRLVVRIHHALPALDGSDPEGEETPGSKGPQGAPTAWTPDLPPGDGGGLRGGIPPSRRHSEGRTTGERGPYPLTLGRSKDDDRGIEDPLRTPRGGDREEGGCRYQGTIGANRGRSIDVDTAPVSLRLLGPKVYLAPQLFRR